MVCFRKTFIFFIFSIAISIQLYGETFRVHELIPLKINENDNIMVCISGGKDSFLMAKCIQELQAHGNIPFEAIYISMNPGYNNKNLEKIKENAKLLNIPIEIFEAPIFQYTKTVEDNPCYLCARMRRGYLYSKAKELGANNTFFSDCSG